MALHFRRTGLTSIQEVLQSVTKDLLSGGFVMKYTNAKSKSISIKDGTFKITSVINGTAKTPSIFYSDPTDLYTTDASGNIRVDTKYPVYPTGMTLPSGVDAEFTCDSLYATFDYLEDPVEKEDYVPIGKIQSLTRKWTIDKDTIIAAQNIIKINGKTLTSGQFTITNNAQTGDKTLEIIDTAADALMSKNSNIITGGIYAQKINLYVNGGSIITKCEYRGYANWYTGLGYQWTHLYRIYKANGYIVDEGNDNSIEIMANPSNIQDILNIVKEDGTVIAATDLKIKAYKRSDLSEVSLSVKTISKLNNYSATVTFDNPAGNGTVYVIGFFYSSVEEKFEPSKNAQYDQLAIDTAGISWSTISSKPSRVPIPLYYGTSATNIDFYTTKVLNLMGSGYNNVFTIMVHEVAKANNYQVWVKEDATRTAYIDLSTIVVREYDTLSQEYQAVDPNAYTTEGFYVTLTNGKQAFCGRIVFRPSMSPANKIECDFSYIEESGLTDEPVSGIIDGKNSTYYIYPSVMGTKFVLESSTSVDPLGATQPWRICIDFDDISVPIKSQAPLGIALVDTGDFYCGKITVGTPIQIGSDCTLTTRSRDDMYTIINTDIFPNPHMDNKTICGSLGRPEAGVLDNNHFMFGTNYASKANPLTYDMSVTDRGFAVSFRIDAEFLGQGNFWMCCQRLVDAKSGDVLDDGRSPLVCLYMLDEPNGFYISYGTNSFKYSTYYTQYYRMIVVREDDVNAPANPIVDITKDTQYINGVWNASKQLSITADNKYVLNIPDGITTNRFLYHNKRLDMIAFTSANVVEESTKVEVNLYNEKQTAAPTKLYNRKYLALRTNGGIKGQRNVIGGTQGPSEVLRTLENTGYSEGSRFMLLVKDKSRGQSEAA